MRVFRHLALQSITLSLVGCAVGPDYQAPETPMPEGYVEAGNTPAQNGPELAQWWKSLDAPGLDALVNEAIARNLDLRLAEARLREARAARRGAFAGLFPTLAAGGTYAREELGRSRFRGVDTPDIPPGTTVASRGAQDDFEASLDLGWEIDVFGGVRRGVEAAGAEVEAQHLALVDVLVSLIAEVCTAYVEYSTASARLEVAERSIEAHRSLVQITRVRFDAGLVSELDVAQSESLLAQREATLPVLETLRKQSIYRLGILLDKQPADALKLVPARSPIPDVAGIVPLGLPSDLLRRRPDVRQAERGLAAATARIGVAEADLFPRFSLTGTFGYTGSSFDELTNGDGKFWSIGPAFRWPIFEGGRIMANIEQADAQTEQALRSYESSVLLALHDVERALLAYGNESRRREILHRAVDADQRSVRLAEELYSRGLVDLLRVIDAQRALYDSEDALIQSRGGVVLDVVILSKALGGGWDPEKFVQ